MTQQLLTNNSDCDHVFKFLSSIMRMCHLHLKCLCTCIYLFVVSVHMCVIVSSFVFLAAALALCKYSQAEWNATNGSANRTVSNCRRHGNGDNCTGRCGQEARGQLLGGVTNGCSEVLRWRFAVGEWAERRCGCKQTHLRVENA